jgi:hypothetical protein
MVGWLIGWLFFVWLVSYWVGWMGGLVWFDLVWFGLLVGFFWLVGWLILVLFDLVGWLVGSVCFVDFFGLNGLLVC